MDFWESINGADSKFRFALTLDGYFEYFFRFIIVSLHDEYNHSCVLGLGNEIRINPNGDFMPQEREKDPRIKECGLSRDTVHDTRYHLFPYVDNPFYFYQPHLYTYFGDRERFREKGRHTRVGGYSRYYDIKSWGSIPFVLDNLSTNFWGSRRDGMSFSPHFSKEKVASPILHYEFWELIRLLIIEFRNCKGNWDAYLSSNTVEYVKGWLMVSMKFEENILDCISIMIGDYIRYKWGLEKFSLLSLNYKSPFPNPYYYDGQIFDYYQFMGLSFNRIQNPYYFMDGDGFYRSIIQTTHFNDKKGIHLNPDPSSEKKEAWRWDSDGSRTFHYVRYYERRFDRYFDDSLEIIKDWDKEDLPDVLNISQSFREFNSKLYIPSVSDHYNFFELRRMVLDSFNHSKFHSSLYTVFRNSYSIVKDIFGFWNGEEYRYNFGSKDRDYLFLSDFKYSEPLSGLGFIFSDPSIDSFRKDWITWIELHFSYIRRPEFKIITRFIKNKNFIAKYEKFRSTRDSN